MQPPEKLRHSKYQTPKELITITVTQDQSTTSHPFFTTAIDTKEQ